MIREKQKLCVEQDGAEKRGGRCVRTSGHVTGYFAGGSREGLKGARQTQCFSRIIRLFLQKLVSLQKLQF